MGSARGLGRIGGSESERGAQSKGCSRSRPLKAQLSARIVAIGASELRERGACSVTAQVRDPEPEEAGRDPADSGPRKSARCGNRGGWPRVLNLEICAVGPRFEASSSIPLLRGFYRVGPRPNGSMVGGVRVSTTCLAASLSPLSALVAAAHPLRFQTCRASARGVLRGSACSSSWLRQACRSAHRWRQDICTGTLTRAQARRRDAFFGRCVRHKCVGVCSCCMRMRACANAHSCIGASQPSRRPPYLIRGVAARARPSERIRSLCEVVHLTKHPLSSQQLRSIKQISACSLLRHVQEVDALAQAREVAATVAGETEQPDQPSALDMELPPTR